MFLINCGSFRSDGGIMYGGIPRRAWQRVDQPDAQNRCVMALNVALVRIENRVVLMDCGVGNVHERYLKEYGFQQSSALQGRIYEECGIHEHEVTDVILSHLHFDHAAGAVYRTQSGQLAPLFPNATHWVSQAQLDYALNPSPLDHESYIKEDIVCLMQNVTLVALHQPTTIGDSLHLHLFEGHTFGQIVTQFSTTEGNFLFVGDTIPTKNHFKKRWGSGYDLEPLKTLSSKQAITELALDANAQLIFPHEKEYPIAPCIKKNGVYRLDLDHTPDPSIKWMP